MKKPFVPIIIVLIGIVLSAIILFFSLQGKKEVALESIHAIPIDASFVLKINDYHRFTNSLTANNLVWKTFKSFNSIKRVDNLIAVVDTLSNRSGAFNKLISAGQMFISVHPLGNKDLGYLASIRIPENISKKDIFESFEDLLNKGVLFKEYVYNDVSITSVKDSASNDDLFYYSYIHDVVLCSSSNLLIESSIRQIDSHVSLLNNDDFVAISNTAGTKVDANLYINSTRIPATFQKFFNQQFSLRLKALSDVATWCEYDITLYDESISLNGFSLSADSTNSFLHVFSRQRPVESKISSVIPSQTAAFINMGISDLDLYLEDYRNYLDKKGVVLDYTSSLGRAKKELGVDIHDLYRSILLKELALVFVPFDGLDVPDCWYVVVRTNSQSQTKQIFNTFLEKYAKTKNIQKSNYKTSYKIDRDKSYEIIRLPIKGINALLFGSLFSDVSDEYFTVIDDFVVFGSSVDALSKMIQTTIHNKQLQLDVSYRQFSEALTSESNYFVYLNPGKIEKLYNTLLESDYTDALSEKHSTIGKIQGVALQLNGGSSMVFNSFSIKYSPSIYEDPKTNWETRLDTSFIMKPQLLINHYTKNREIVVQDLKNKLYLLNDVGRILWTKQLTETILGEISQVDLFKNGKLQFLFNTENFLYAIDRKGDFVKNFPVKLKVSASAPVSVFDYDNNRDYRFLVPCVDRKIYAYGGQGKPILGWSFVKSERVVFNQPQHFKVKGKDYIVFADQNRPYILDRKGDERVRLSRYFSKSKNSSFSYEGATSKHAERLVTTDSLGLIRYIYFNGKVEDLAIKAFTSNHAFDYQDIDADGNNDFVFLDGKQISIYSQSKNLLFNYRFDYDILPRLLFFNFGGSNRKLGVVSTFGNEIYLLNGGGSLFDGFPLRGNTLFSIGQLTSNQAQFNLFVGSSSGALMNYSVK